MPFLGIGMEIYLWIAIFTSKIIRPPPSPLSLHCKQGSKKQIIRLSEISNKNLDKFQACPIRTSDVRD